ncbi:MAG: hypothetical protein JWN01_94 [Patescibacteria group bacterium]|nr:hypothetical protein [Patescibacteria group bacterium]
MPLFIFNPNGPNYEASHYRSTGGSITINFQRVVEHYAGAGSYQHCSGVPAG